MKCAPGSPWFDGSRLSASLLLALVMSSRLFLAADESADVTLKRRLVELDDDNFETREAAEEGLRQTGGWALEAVRKEHEKPDNSAEKRMRLTRVLPYLASNYVWDSLVDPPRESISIADGTIVAAAKEIAAKYKFDLQLDGNVWADAPVSLQLKNATWAEAVAALCEQADLTPWPHDEAKSRFIRLHNFRKNGQCARAVAGSGGVLCEVFCRSEFANDDAKLPHRIALELHTTAIVQQIDAHTCRIASIDLIDGSAVRELGSCFCPSNFIEAKDDIALLAKPGPVTLAIKLKLSLPLTIGGPDPTAEENANAPEKALRTKEQELRIVLPFVPKRKRQAQTPKSDVASPAKMPSSE